jgi:hypothetical protein
MGRRGDAMLARWLRLEVLGAIALVAVSTLSGVLLFFLADYFLLSRWLVDPDTVLDRFDRYDHGWYMLKPNLNVTFRWGAEINQLTTDSNGFRVDDVARRADGPADFIFLGDSFTFGINGSWSKTLVGKFEHGCRSRVINAGTNSYSPTPYIYQYRRALAAKLLKPHHAVVVALDISDVQDEAAVWEDGSEHPQHREHVSGLAIAAPPGSLPVESHFVAWKIISRFVHPKVTSVFGGTPKPEPAILNWPRSAFTWRPWVEIDSDYRPLGVEGGLDRVRQKLRVLADMARQNGGELWLVIYPWPAQLEYGENVFNWEEFNDKLCVEIRCKEIINTFPLFRSDARWYSTYFLPGDVHFNDRGNQLVADALLARAARGATSRK